MNRIIILDQEEDLSEWLEKNGLTIVVRRANYGHIADFQQSYCALDRAPQPTGTDPLDAVRGFVWSLRGARIDRIGPLPADLLVPEFSGIEQAVAQAVHADSRALLPKDPP